MNALHELQEDFLDGVFDATTTPAILDRLDGGGRLPSAARFQIYQNNARLILTEVLKNTFPATVRLAGEDFFIYICRQFIVIRPPATTDLNGYGGAFPDFIAGIAALRPYPFIADVARLEWDRHLSYLADTPRALSSADLALVPGNEIAALQLVLSPHVRLLSSAFPVDRIWRANRPGENEDGDSINLDQGPAFLITCREDLQVVTVTLTPDVFSFLQSCRAGLCLLDAANATLEKYPAFALEHHLPRLLSLKLFKKVP